MHRRQELRGVVTGGVPVDLAQERLAAEESHAEGAGRGLDGEQQGRGGARP